MRPALLKKIIAVVLLVAVVAIAGNGRCFAQDAGHTLQASYGKADVTALNTGYGDECPCCPDDDGHTAAHCGACLSCPCHAPLNSQGALVPYIPLIVSLSILEPLNAPPEVYCSIFVPPQIAV